MRVVFAILLLAVAVSCFKFTSNEATVQVGGGQVRSAIVKADTVANEQEIIYTDFSVSELEIFDEKSRFQSCSSDCSNYFVGYPLTDYGNRSNRVTNNPVTINGIPCHEYQVTQNGYLSRMWVSTADSDVIVRVIQTGSGIDRTFNFASFVKNQANISNAPTGCATVQCDKPLDIMLVLDASGSISNDDYATELDFARSVVSSFSVTDLGVHIGLVTFATEVFERIGLSSNPGNVNNAIDNSPQQFGQTNIGGAILTAHNEIAENGRNNVPQIIILITDGQANEPAGGPVSPVVYMYNEAESAKSDDILLYVIGVGNSIDESELADIASGEEYTAFVDDFSALINTIQGILEEVCIGGAEDTCSPACGDNFFCGCSDCICTLNQDHCEGRGTLNVGTCKCDNCEAPYSSAGVDDCSTCATPCQHDGVQDEFCNCQCNPSGSTLWEGDHCEICNVSCGPNEQTIPNCGGCTCQAGTGWTGANCDICSPTFCANGGVPNEDCNGCTCPAGTGWTASSLCNTCNFECNGNGDAVSSCDACVCDDDWDGDNCEICARNCNGRGVGINNCNSCDCDNNWSGGRCQHCNFCGSHGTPDSSCSTCTCDLNYSGATCNVCDLTTQCQNGGVPINDCTKCRCEGAYEGEFCETCDTSVCVNGVIDDCSVPNCTCDEGFQGDLCDECHVDLCNSRGEPTDDTCSLCNCEGAYIGNFCETCNENCQNGGSRDNKCNLCVCPNFWDGELCEVCDSSNPSDYCNGRGFINDDGNCNSCTCNEPEIWGGNTCNQCVYDCHGNGSPNSQCSACECGLGWTVESDCEICDDSALADYCNGRGFINDDGNCDTCTCTNTDWDGQTCTNCIFDCNDNGTPNSECNGCECEDGWTVESACMMCDDSPNADFCNGRGSIVDDGNCNTCTCNEPDIWGGATCSECVFNCNGNGSPNSECSACECEDGWTVESACMMCDDSALAELCNERGLIIDDGNCNSCTCTVEQWSGTTCTECPIDCNGNGTPNAECSACECDNNWSIASACTECPMICENGGTPNAECSACECVGGYTSDSLCAVCDESYFDNCENDAIGLNDCQCECSDRWVGQFCTDCTLAEEGQCNADNTSQGGIIDIPINGEPQCRCACIGYYDGDNCDECSLNPEEGDAACDGIAEPNLETCTCHCPDYYRDEEGCRECIIVFDDCVHPEIGSGVDQHPDVCACTDCAGNWSGRDCSECEHVCDESIGEYLDETICECVSVCGDGIIALDEICEIALIDEVEDHTCCVDCYFEEKACDDLVECTFDDRCLGGECDGLGEINFEFDQDRNPLPLGPFSNDYWARWGVVVTTAGNVELEVYDSLNDLSDPRWIFPSQNVNRGGDNIFGNILTVTSDNPNLLNPVCFEFSSPMYVESTIVLSVVKDTSSVDFYCTGGNEDIPMTVPLCAWGVGSMQPAYNPCNGPVNRICYNEFANAAIASIYMCEDPYDHIFGSIGDYVWHDFTVDNNQDSFEIGIPNVGVQLHDSNGIQITETVTDENGLYLFNALYPDTYTVLFYGPNGYKFSTPEVNLFNDDVLHEGEITNIELGLGEDILWVDAGLYLFGSIGDYIFLDENRNGRQDESIGIEDVRLDLYRNGDFFATEYTSSIGEYRFENLPIFASATEYNVYEVKMTPPENSVVTIQNADGVSDLLDSDFDPISYWSHEVILTPEEQIDITIDGGIYYCCGSVGDFVFYDEGSSPNGIQDPNEDGVPDIVVRLFLNAVPIASTTTDINGFYLFEGLDLGDYDYHISFERPPNYVWTSINVGNDEEIDSDVDASGTTEVFHLTVDEPHIRYIDAGIKEGCETSEECAQNADVCSIGTCERRRCSYQELEICEQPENVCFDAFCLDGVSCIEVPTTDTNRFCNDGNDCTINDVCGPNGECHGTPSNNPCDDGNDCTEDDVCGPNGECIGTPIKCTGSECVDSTCVAGECQETFNDNTCDDGNPCTENDRCDPNDGICKGTPKDCSVSDQCKKGICEESTGECVVDNIDASCSDGSLCTINDVCVEGVCVGEPKICETDSVCHESTCIFGDCVDSFIDRSCDDGNACTINDRCDPIDEVCRGTDIICEDLPCTINECFDGKCVPRADEDAVCDDNDECTTNVCDGMTCRATEIDCDDGNPCTDDRCVNGVCENTNNTLPCDDNDKCTTVDMCVAGECRGVDVRCDDGELCTTDTCDPESGECVFTNNSVVCDDGNLCTANSVCVEGVCTGYDENTCDDIVPSDCEIAFCDVVTGTCSTSPVDDETPCDDGNACTISSCKAGICVATEIDCNDNDPCTDDICINGLCTYIATVVENQTCDDGNACTEGDTCENMLCVGIEIDCGDDNECTNDTCNPETGECINDAVEGNIPCDDGLSCTLNDACVESQCVGTPLECVSTVCVISECSEETGECEETNTTNDCDDGNPCTLNDACFEGECVSFTNTVCENDNICEVGVCNTSNGNCEFVNVDDQTPCDDGRACTENDVCVSGQCVGTPIVCESSENVCVDVVCQDGECVNINLDIECDDGNACTTVDECVEGVCVGFEHIECTSDNICVESECVEGVCVDRNIDDIPCNDFDSCTGNDICTGGECAGEILDECIDECVIDEDCSQHSENLCFIPRCIQNECIYSEILQCENNDVCITISCNPDSGVCEDELHTDAPCDDGNECTQTDVCAGGSCLGTNTVQCEVLECRVGVCSSESGECEYEITEGTECDDGNSCTLNDVCNPNGECNGTPIDCSDGNICTDNVCVDGTCVSSFNGVDCNDNDLCTENDVCSEGTCSGTPKTCVDDLCHEATCENGVCVQRPTNDNCDDGNECTVNDVCVNGQCVGTLFECPSDDVCMEGSCSPQSGQCVYTPTSNSCDDGNACTTEDRCINGECRGVEVDCSELDTECGVGICMNDQCTFVSDDFENISCDDGNACTEGDACVAGECRGEEVICENENPCSIGSCDTELGCVFENLDISCDNGNLCLLSVCVDQQCVDFEEPTSCDDGNPCTDDRCDPFTGDCEFEFNADNACEDEDPCTIDICTPEGCESTRIDCDDGNECTNDSCENGVCVFVPNDNECEIDDFCVAFARCELGVCTSQEETFCPDDGACARGFCDVERQLCGFEPQTGNECDDSNACTINDVCQPDFTCAGTFSPCEPAINPCQQSICDPVQGCINVSNDEGECGNPNDSCASYSCSNGDCIPDFNPCVDDELCTVDNVCLPESGCFFKEYSCILSPCVFLDCDGFGECAITDNVDSWNPLVYIALTSTVGSEERHYINSISSTNAQYQDFIEVADPVLSIAVHPMGGNLFLIGGSAGRSLQRMTKRNDGTLNEDITTVVPNTGLTDLDLSFKPTLKEINTGYRHSLWALSRGSSSDVYQVNPSSLSFSPVANTPTNYEVFAWDNHGDYMFGIVGKQLHAWSPVDNQDNVLCSGEEFVPNGDLISITVRVDETLVGAVQEGADLHVFTVDFQRNEFNNAICQITTFTVPDAALFNPQINDDSDDGQVTDDDDLDIHIITAVAFDDTVCVSGNQGGFPGSDGGQGGGQGGNGGTPGNNSGSGSGSDGSGSNLPPPPPPGNNANPPSSNGGSDFPGVDTNYVLTGTEGQVSTAIIGAIGAGSVALFAVFAVLFGLNNTKKDPEVPIGALLETTEASNLAAENPIFQNPAGASSNVLA